MRLLPAVLLLLTICLAGCRKSKDNIIIKPGTYSGTFQRTSNDMYAVATLEFTHGTWSGESPFPKYPAVCHGTYKTSGSDRIRFDNECAFTADFDWTLILNGNYKLKVNGDSLEISRDYGGYMDIYKLKKQ